MRMLALPILAENALVRLGGCHRRYALIKTKIATEIA